MSDSRHLVTPKGNGLNPNSFHVDFHDVRKLVVFVQGGYSLVGVVNAPSNAIQHQLGNQGDNEQRTGVLTQNACRQTKKLGANDLETQRQDKETYKAPLTVKDAK